jgi:hypothetical protein
MMHKAESHMHQRVPVWLGEIVKARMERLRLLNLDGQPLGRSMGEVVRIWAQILAARLPMADDALDGPRIHAAFDVLERTCDRWPQPANLLAALPALPALPELPKLPPPEPTPEERASAKAAIAEMVAKFRMR